MLVARRSARLLLHPDQARRALRHAVGALLPVAPLPSDLRLALQAPEEEGGRAKHDQDDDGEVAPAAAARLDAGRLELLDGGPTEGVVAVDGAAGQADQQQGELAREVRLENNANKL